MNNIDLLLVEPHKVSRDLRGYTVMFYGDPKTGKTTIASKFPKSLLLGFEKGYLTIPGVMAQPVNSWSDFLKIVKQLKTSEIKEKFDTIVIDTIDIAYDFVEKHICNIHGVDAIGDIPFGKGYSLTYKEFDSKLRDIVQNDYGLVLISHAQDKVFTDENDQEYNKIVPTLTGKGRLVATRMADIIGYSRGVENEDGKIITYLFMRGTYRFEAGSRFKYTPNKIIFSYDNLVDAIAEAITEEAKETGSKYVTDERESARSDSVNELDFDALKAEAESLIEELIEKDAAHYAPRITQIIERNIGKNQKLGDASRDQASLVEMIVSELKE